MDDPFFLESVEEPPCSSCKDSFSSGNKKSIPGFPTGMASSFLTFVMLTLMSLVPRPSPTVAPSKEMAFTFSHTPPVGTNLGFVFLPVKYFVLILEF